MAKRRKALPIPDLSSSDSEILIPCYASHGKGKYEHAPTGAKLLVVLINAERQVREVVAVQGYSWELPIEGVPMKSGWRILGWRMADGSTPLGEHDVVDPAMADFPRLPIPNTPPSMYYPES